MAKGPKPSVSPDYGVKMGMKKVKHDEATCRCCGKVGHMKADCNMVDKGCSLCGMFGHVKATCRQAGNTGTSAPPWAGGKGTGGKGLALYTPPSSGAKGGKGGKGGRRMAEEFAGPSCNCCGKVGHLKKDCPMKEKTCVVCGKVGHLKSTCNSVNEGLFYETVGPTQAHVEHCFCCGRFDHSKRDCPLKEKECTLCGKVGHIKRMCHMASEVAFHDPSVAAAEPCFCCGKTGHTKRDCPMKDKECTLCGMTGHIKRMCRLAVAPQEAPISPDQCLCCGKFGHAKRDCPMKDKQCVMCGKVGHLKSTCHSSNVMFQEPLSGSVSSCMCCGKTGHMKKQCPMQEKECSLCGKIGHLRSMCQSAGNQQNLSAALCMCCGLAGHQKKECPMKEKECSLCGLVGHLKRTCRSAGTQVEKPKQNASVGLVKKQHLKSSALPTKAKLDNTIVCLCCGKSGHAKADCKMADLGCSICGMQGHVKATCRQAGDTVKTVPKKTIKHILKKEKDPSKKRCYNCQEYGHEASDCSSPKICSVCRSADHVRTECPHKDETCDHCGKKGHVSEFCQLPEKN